MRVPAHATASRTCLVFKGGAGGRSTSTPLSSPSSSLAPLKPLTPLPEPVRWRGRLAVEETAGAWPTTRGDGDTLVDAVWTWRLVAILRFHRPHKNSRMVVVDTLFAPSRPYALTLSRVVAASSRCKHATVVIYLMTRIAVDIGLHTPLHAPPPPHPEHVQSLQATCRIASSSVGPLVARTPSCRAFASTSSQQASTVAFRPVRSVPLPPAGSPPLGRPGAKTYMW
jgi:hypothetical protein